LDERVVRLGDAAADAAVKAFLHNVGRTAGVVVSAPAGAGKTGLVCKAVAGARRERIRVVVGSPTNEQAFGLVRRLAVTPGCGQLTYLPAGSIQVPSDLRRVARIVDSNHADGAEVLVATVDKLGDAFARDKLRPFDALILDESFQADSRRYFGVADLAPAHLLVGDGGQLSPFSTWDEADRWRGQPEDPLQTAVGVLRRNHPDTLVQPLPISRRLDARAVQVCRAFYPALPFEAAAPEGVRELNLESVPAGARRARALDAALEHAAHAGWAHFELPPAPVLQADPETIELLVALVTRLLQRGPTVRCERMRERTPLDPGRVAVGVSHNDQKDLLRVALGDAGLGQVVVETANKLQGLEYDVLFAWHPLAGLAEADGFHLDPGRLCVLLTRHRHACVVVGRAADRALLEGVPPATRAYLGFDPDPVLDGWGAHEAVFAALDEHNIGL
jgi:hypothetical protein